MPFKSKDLSAHLGLSVSTISKALNGCPDISEATRNRVVTAAHDLGYHPDAAARNLRRRRSDKIGLMVNTPMAYISESLSGLFPGMASALEQSSANLILYLSAIKDPLNELVQICRSREVDGIIMFWSADNQAAIDILEEENFPYVFMDRRVEHPNASYVVPEKYVGAYELTNHLISLGHTRIGFMTRPSQQTTNADRLRGYQQALSDAGIPYEEDLVIPTKIEADSGYQEMLYFLDMSEPPTATIAFHDLVAVSAFNAIRDRNLRIPEDIALAGFDDLPSSRMTNPPITTVRYSYRELGKKVVESLIKRIDDKDGDPIQLTIPTEVVIRPSTDPTIKSMNKSYVQL